MKYKLIMHAFNSKEAPKKL